MTWFRRHFVELLIAVLSLGVVALLLTKSADERRPSSSSSSPTMNRRARLAVRLPLAPAAVQRVEDGQVTLARELAALESRLTTRLDRLENAAARMERKLAESDPAASTPGAASSALALDASEVEAFTALEQEVQVQEQSLRHLRRGLTELRAEVAGLSRKLASNMRKPVTASSRSRPARLAVARSKSPPPKPVVPKSVVPKTAHSKPVSRVLPPPASSSVRPVDRPNALTVEESVLAQGYVLEVYEDPSESSMEDLVDLGGTRLRKLREAAALGWDGLVGTLLDGGVDPNGVDPEGRTPMMLAAEAGNRAVVEILLAYGADPGMEDDTGRTAAAAAWGAGHRGLSRLLSRANSRHPAP